jgi:hypothetical protein
MSRVRIRAGRFEFAARLEEADAPRTCAVFRAMLPYRSRIIQARWSGEAAWIPLGGRPVELGYENHTSHPARGEILFYPGGLSEPEIFFPYGNASFASKVGQLAGNHFLSIVEGLADLPAFGHVILWEGAQDIAFELSDELLG